MGAHASGLCGRGGGTINAPLDQPQRSCFINELERNFSVVASAGSGKTRAITDRIVAMARHERAREWLPSLLVVTYTNRAAAEMQQRARESILEANLPLEVLAAFNRAFFGTIHSLCMRLLRHHGHHLGMPCQLDHLDENDDAALWREFVQHHTTVGTTLDPAQRRALLRLAPARQLMEIGRKATFVTAAIAPGPFPAFDFGEIHAFAPDKRSLAAVTRCREALLRWEEAWGGGGFVGPLPACESKPLRTVWDAAVAPIRQWRQAAALHTAAEVSAAYRRFRLGRGAMTYGDQIALAAELLRHPEAAPRIRAKNHRVILDEAQDTDPAQFDVLLEIARPPEAAGAWLNTGANPPRAGHFCMVGDFQQSIYGGRADLDHYQRIHEMLVSTGAGEALEFSVTFRLDEAGISFVNAAFPAVLHGADRQIDFVRLSARPAALPGQVLRFNAPPPNEAAEWKDWRKARWEADRLAAWLRSEGLEKLRASSWCEVAVLCPRTRWLPALQIALQRAGLDAQIQSERAIRGDSPAYAWFTALAVVLADPRDGYEIVGVLREVFGLSDDALARFSEGRGERFHLTAPTSRKGPVAETLNALTALRERARTLPLFSAMDEMMRSTQLRTRLQALPPVASDGMEDDLAELLTQAGCAEAAGATLESFAADLRAGFHATRGGRTIRRNAVQIISGHKAKGCEWEAVIVPFFARRVDVRHPALPCLVRDPRTRETIAALDGDDVNKELKEAIAVRDQQELGRLLYVALTRAKHTLVLVDDRALFSGKNGVPKNAQARVLHCAEGEVQAAMIEALPAMLAPCTATVARHAEKTVQCAQNRAVEPLEAIRGEVLVPARRRAALFLKRNPSALAEAALAEADPIAYEQIERRPPAAPNAGQLYGTWWHKFVERLDWYGDAATWDAVFDDALDDSPDPALSRREWVLLRGQLTGGSELARLLRPSGAVAHAELPFLWAMNARECLDGILDLAVFDPEAGAWLILDWKTNRAKTGDLPALRAHYLPQLSAYWKAASEMLAAPVAAGIYATASGEWLPYKAGELEAAWRALADAPANLERALGEP